jgi:hypothetical protein
MTAARNVHLAFGLMAMTNEELGVRQLEMVLRGIINVHKFSVKWTNRRLKFICDKLTQIESVQVKIILIYSPR